MILSIYLSLDDEVVVDGFDCISVAGRMRLGEGRLTMKRAGKRR